MKHYTARYLKGLPTLCVGQSDSLKIEKATERVWLARTGVADGEPYENRISHERLIDGRWETVESYPG